jgi:hypothetical protein
MFPGGLETLSTLLLALVVGCGLPALIYLAFRGKPTEKPTEKMAEEPKPSKPKAEPTKEELSKVVGYMDAFVHVPVPIKGYLYVPIDFLEEALKQTGYVPTQKTAPKPEPEKPSKPPGKPLIERVK